MRVSWWRTYGVWNHWRRKVTSWKTVKEDAMSRHIPIRRIMNYPCWFWIWWKHEIQGGRSMVDSTCFESLNKSWIRAWPQGKPFHDFFSDQTVFFYVIPKEWPKYTSSGSNATTVLLSTEKKNIWKHRLIGENLKISFSLARLPIFCRVVLHL